MVIMSVLVLGGVVVVRRLTVGDVRRANIPERYWDVRFSAIPEGLEYREKVGKYLSDLPDMLDKGIGLYLWSLQNSTGKTSIATLVIKQALRHRKTAFFEESGRLKNLLIKGDNFEEGVTIENRVLNVDVLVIDDIGKEYRTQSGFAENQLETIVRARVQNMKTTIMTGNVHPKDLKNIYSEDFSALLRESMVQLNIVGHDFRAERERELRSLL